MPPGRRIDSWSRALVRNAGIELEVIGRRHVTTGANQPYVVMINHQSHYDIPVLFQAFEPPLRMVGKRELFRVPVWGAAMEAAGFIKVDRKNRQQAIESLKRAQASMSRGVSIWIAPEGTRSRTGALGPFKKGGFHLAIDTEAPILPVTVVGTRHVLPPKSLRVTSGVKVQVKFSPPISTGGKTVSDIPRLMASVHEAINRQLPEDLRGDVNVA